MSALDNVLTEREIRVAFDEFGVSAGSVRMTMLGRARDVLGSASREFAEYERALAAETADTDRITHGSSWRFGRAMRVLSIGVGLIGGIMIVMGVTASAFRFLEWPGGAILLVAGTLAAAPLFLGPDLDVLLDQYSVKGMDVVAARERLMQVLGGGELLAQIRTVINVTRPDRSDVTYSVVGSPGLSEVYERLNTVPTAVADELDGLFSRFDGGSIGVAGPRGSGKSTLIRGYCDEIVPAGTAVSHSAWDVLLGSELAPHSRGDLRCMVAAPVDYIARDFVLHLFAVFCRSVITRQERWRRDLPAGALAAVILRKTWLMKGSLFWRIVVYGLLAASLLYWKRAIVHEISLPAAWVSYAAIAVACVGLADIARLLIARIRIWMRQIPGSDQKALAATARNHLTRVRYLQTYTSGWSGTLSLTGGRAAGTHTRSIARSEQALSYPEIVNEFRGFARDVAHDLHRDGDRVFIGVDELDKIGTAQQAENFLNEIKGIFGIPHVYFIVSVSDDALTSFERRGLPLRDAFDSSFDEIIHVGPLSYIESRRLLYRRVVGLNEPYVALCHCLAGGLARDLIRAARQVVRTATWLAAKSPASPTLGSISARLVQDELHRKARAVSHVLRNIDSGTGSGMQELLYDLDCNPDPSQQAMSVVDVLVGQPGKHSADVATLRFDLAAYAYYCATLQEVFTDHLTSERIAEATSESAVPGNFDELAAARYTFALDTSLAWRSITQFRKAWQLETREPLPM